MSDKKRQEKKASRRRKKDYIRSRKTPCILCGYFGHPEAIDFHHVFAEEKLFGLATVKDESYAKIDLEISKCACLCSNCHRLHHAGVIPASEIIANWKTD